MPKLKKRSAFFWQQGSSLVEVLIATTVVAMVLTTITAGLTLTLRTVSESKYRNYAQYYGQDALEFFRRERVKYGWAVFADTMLTFNSSICLSPTPDDLNELSGYASSCDSGFPAAGGEFFREVQISSVDSSTLKVTVTVSWYDNNRLRSIDIEQLFREY